MNWQRAFVRSLIAAAACSALAAAQTPSSPQPNNPMSLQPSTLSRQMPETLAGVESGKVVRWTLKDVILAALEKNVDIEIERENVRLAEFDLLVARGVYDPLTSSSIFYNAQKTPNSFRFSGSAQSFVQTNTVGYNFGFSQLVEHTGGSYQVNFNNSRVTSNTSSLSTAYSPVLTATFTQPLLRNFRTDTNRHQITIAKKKLDLSDAEFRQRVIEIIAGAQAAYWDLAFAIRNEEIQRDAVKLAEAQLKNNQLQVEVGTLAPIDVISAAAQLESNRQQVYQAMNTVAQAESALKAMTVESPNAELWEARIVPVESFELQPLALSIADAINLALANRPEVKQFALQKEMNRIDTGFFRNQTKPQVDLVATYSLAGLGGAAALFPDQNGAPQPANVFPGLIGGYGTALGNLFGANYPTWRVGVNFSLPLRNRVAEANLGRALESGRQLDLQTRKQLQAIEVEVRNAYHAAETARLRVEAARVARQYAEQQLTGEEKKFASGLSTTFLILTRQNDLSQARGVEVRALTDYNKAVADLQRAISTTLSSNSIEIKSELANPESDGEKIHH